MIYFDNNATTIPLPEVVEVMGACLREDYANPSSVHQFGQSVRHKIECAREQVAALLGATPREVIFTSGGTESINLAIRGALQSNPSRRRIVTTPVEHTATLSVMEQLAATGYEVIRVGVDQEGRIDEAEWADAITEDTALVSLLYANNETGVLFDVPKLATIAEAKGAIVHIDAVQAAGKIPIVVEDWPVHLVSISAHKFHGPKGIGALYVKRRTRVSPQIVGGSQERLLRGGTENVAGIVGMGLASKVALRDMDRVANEVRQMRGAFEASLIGSVPFARVVASTSDRLHTTSNIAFGRLQAEAILILLSEASVCASAGSACSSGSLEPSHVLQAMGIDESLAHGAIRFSFSKFNTPGEIDEVVSLLPDLLSRLTKLSGGAAS